MTARAPLTFLLLVLVRGSGVGADRFALAGDTIQSGRAVPTIVIVAGSRIEAVQRRGPVPAGVPVVSVDGLILPGFIDLHDHLTWDALPRWKPSATYGNRSDWQSAADYERLLAHPHAELLKQQFGCALEQFGEIKAMFGGATSVTGSGVPNSCMTGFARAAECASGQLAEIFRQRSSRATPARTCPPGPLRTLDQPAGERSTGSGDLRVRYEVFPLSLSRAQRNELLGSSGSPQTPVLLIHAAEGRDVKSHAEFNTLDAEGFLRPRVALIHGISLTRGDLQTLAARGVGLVWSPRSNVELYGATADVEQALNLGVTVALGPDWNPTGSSGMLDEMHFASGWAARHWHRKLTDAELLGMATGDPARLAGLDRTIGAIAPGLLADLIVVPYAAKQHSEYLAGASPATIRLLIADGVPRMGEPLLMRRLAPSARLEGVTVCGAGKLLNVADKMQGATFASLQTLLRERLAALGVKMAPLAECN